MGSQESRSTSPADIELDEQGRIALNAPELASVLKSADVTTAGIRRSNGYCPTVNTVMG